MKPALLKTLAIVLIGVLLLASTAKTLAAPKDEVQTVFPYPPTYPSDGPLVLGPDGYYWGTTIEGGAYAQGTIYKVKADGSGWVIVMSFSDNGSTNKGSLPIGGLFYADHWGQYGVRDKEGRLTGEVAFGEIGCFWGTTRNGGAGDSGTVFQYFPRGDVFNTVVVEFNGQGLPYLGSEPLGGLLQGPAEIWGTTSKGGKKNHGTIFAINGANGGLATLVDFTGNGTKNKGSFPLAGLVSDGKGFLWGTTSGGGKHGCGTVFKLNPLTRVLTTLVEFTGNDGNNKGRSPEGILSNDEHGSYWGTTARGGKHDCGTVFKINADTGVLSTLLEFSGKGGTCKGTGPVAKLVSDGHGSLWGSTCFGGEGGCGTLFKINAASGVLTTLVDFTRDGAKNRGDKPRAPLVKDDKGSFLGTTTGGGTRGYGTVFKIDIATGVLTTLVELGKVGP